MDRLGGQTLGPADEFFAQADAAEYRLRAHQVMNFFVPEHRGHDDLLDAAALRVQVAPLGQLRRAAASRPSRAALNSRHASGLQARPFCG